MTELDEVLTKIGFTEDELKVYEVVVAFNFRTVGQISSYTNLDISKVHQVCESLISKNFLKKLVHKSEEAAVYIPLTPKIAITASVSQNLSNKLEKLSSEVNELWNEAQSHIDTDIQTIVASLKEGIDKLIKNLSNFKNEHAEAIERSNNGFQNHLRSVTDETADIFQNDINVPLAKLSEELETISNKVIEICNASLSKINKANGEHEKKILVTSGQIKEELVTFTDSIALFATGRISSLTQQIEETSGETTENASKLIDEMNSFINAVIKTDEKNVKQTKTEFPVDFLESYEDQKKMVTELTDHHYSEFISNIDSTVKANKKSIEEAIMASEKMFDFIEEGQKTKLVDLQTEMLSAIKSVQSEAVKKLDNILTSTSKSLKGENTAVSKNIKSFNKALNTDLAALKDSLTLSLNDKFESVEKQLTGFVDNLKTSSTKNVKEITSSVDELREFVTEYLQSIKSDLASNLDQLQNDVLASLSETTKLADENITSSVKGSNETLSNVKTSFDDNIANAMTNFNEAVSKRDKEQNLKMTDLVDETETINSDLKKAREEINQLLESQLGEMKESTIDELNKGVSSTVDTYSIELTRFNENMDQQFRSFYENFHSQSSGLREEVPEKIEGLLLDQTDRLDNFRRDFQRIMGHATDTLAKFLTSFSSDGKKIDKKQVPIIYGDVTRAVQDFKHFENQLSDHFNKTIEDTEDLKSQFLDEINKIIQNELSDLENIVTSQSESIQSTTKEYLGNLSQNTTSFMETITTSTEEKISSLKSNISTKMLSDIQQPLNDILSAAHTLATGTEGGEQENRLLISQKELVLEIESELKSHKDSMETHSKEQFETYTSMSKSLKKIVKEATTKIDKAIDSSVKSTNSNVDNTVVTKTEEIDLKFSEKNSELLTATDSNLKDVDTSLKSFKSEFQTILSETTGGLSSTIDTASSTQTKSVNKTLDQMSQTTESTIKTLDTTKTSLNENVAKPMEKVKVEVDSLIGKYDQMVAGEKMMLQSEISNFFDSSSKQVSEISSLKGSFKKIKVAYFKELEVIAKKLDTSLKGHLDKNLENRSANIIKFKESLLETVSKIDENNTGFILNLYDQVNTQLSMLQVEINENLNATKDNIDNEVTNIIETVRSDIVSTAEEVSLTISNEKETTPTKLNEISATLNSLSGAQDSEFLRAKNNFLKKISDEILSRGDEWKTSIQKSYENQTSSLSTLFDDFNSQIGDHSSTGKENVTRQIGKIPDTIDDTLDAAAKSMHLLNQISTGSINLDAKFPELSYFDTSKEAIMANMNGILSRTKSSLTIVSPTISWINENLIESFSRVSVKIITDLDQHTPEDNRILELFTNHGINLDLRKLDKNRFRGNIDMIMATRDREEVILAKLPDSTDAYAFVSQDEVFIEKFTELFAPFQTMPRVS
ncbi:MAG: hypothetical protein GPJ54_22165 [Candidatus Heimdallarchaeota archaeon]|nr:hypothetical protein [Candidatus Heimdallarchaeota archaeon]